MTVRDSPSWAFLSSFHVQFAPTGWAASDALAESLRVASERIDVELHTLRAEWRRLLAPLGDPSDEDWLHFRPLRTDREEDWSDWFAYLLESSKTGALGYRLFGSTTDRADDFAGPRVDREVRTENRRADLVIQLRAQATASVRRMSVEVKVGDKAFGKTADTARKLQGGTKDWQHFILLPGQDHDRWRESNIAEVASLTWEDVAEALRRVLRSRGEPQRWQVWAHAFCGVIEQRLLGFGHPSAHVAELRLLRRTMEHG